MTGVLRDYESKRNTEYPEIFRKIRKMLNEMYEPLGSWYAGLTHDWL